MYNFASMAKNIEFITKYGVNGLLVVALVWMNNRLDKVEEKLYDCYEQQIATTNTHKPIEPIKYKCYAVLPEKDDKRYTRTAKPS